MIITGLIHNLETECHEKINNCTFILFVFIKKCKKKLENKGGEREKTGINLLGFCLENVCINA